MSTAEALNNAIIALDWAAPGEPKGVKRAIGELAKHWVAFWNGERTSMGRVELGQKLQRYAQWYARAWALVAPEIRAQVPDPRSIDTSWNALLTDEIRQVLEGAQAAVNAGATVQEYVKDQAKGLRDELERVHSTLLLDVVIVGAVAAFVLLAFGKSKGY